MSALPAALGGTKKSLFAWRLDRAKWAKSWRDGEGAYQAGGRWNPIGFRAVYTSLDPATATLEVAVHKGFDVLDTQHHVLTRFALKRPKSVRVFQAEDLPNIDWLDPNFQSAAQKDWGAEMLEEHEVIAVPSAVSRESWNLVLKAPVASADVTHIDHADYLLDPRLAAARRA